jgi:Tol biopolymer transport system component
MASKKKQSDENLNSISINPDLEKKVDAMLSLEPEAPSAPEVPTIKEETPEPEADKIVEDLPSEPTPVEEPAVVSGAPVLPVNKTAAFRKKIAVTDDDSADTIPVKTEPKVQLPADNELEPFEPPAPVVAPEPPKVEPAPVPAPTAYDELGLMSASTSRAVDEIIASEADALLESQDEAISQERNNVAKRAMDKQKKDSSSSRKKLFFKIFFLLIFIAVAVAGAVPASRYWVLNTAGVRVSSSLTILDQSSGQPLKNATFTIEDNSVKTDAEGNARLDNLKLGKHTVKVSKPAYAEYSQSVVLGWGSNPLGEQRLTPTSSQYTILVKDFLSDKPVARVDASSGEANARSNEAGKIVLAIPQTDKDTVEVKIVADGYREETLAINLSDTAERTVTLVPSRKHAFVSKQAGTFDVYTVDVDGKNEKRVLKGTGREKGETMALAMHPTKNLVALISTRDQGSDQDTANTLTIVNLDTEESKTVASSQRIQLVNWVGDKLVFVKIGTKEGDSSKTRHRLVSYDSNTKSERELASTNYFNDVLAVGSSIYFAPASYEVNGSVGLFKINADGNVRKTVADKEIWNMLRTDYGKLAVFTGQDWYDLDTSNDVMTKSQAPSIQKSRDYTDAPSGASSLWDEERDGKGVLLSYNKETKESTQITAQSGLRDPMYWLDQTHIVYRVSSTAEIADYVLSTDGGVPKKIRDVTDTAGVDRWYYY